MDTELHLRVAPVAGESGAFGLRFEFRSGRGALVSVETNGPHRVEDITTDVRRAAEPAGRAHLPGGAATRAALEAAGRALFDRLLPAGVASAIRALADDGRLAVHTSEGLVPWELLHDGRDFLALRLRMARALVVQGRGPAPKATAARRRSALFVASDPRGDLPACGTEIAHLAALFEGRAATRIVTGARATRPVVAGLLAGEPFDLIHYAGHAEPAAPDRPARLVLADGQALVPGDLDLAVAAPLVFLNACHSADEMFSGAAYEVAEFAYHGLASAFAQAGARAVIGALWPVTDEGACAFGAAFYRVALDGSPLGDAVRAARRALLAERPGDPSWAAYAYYGDLNAGLFEQPDRGGDDWMSLREAAGALGIRYAEAYRMARGSELVARTIDGQLMVERRAVEHLKSAEITRTSEVSETSEVCGRCRQHYVGSALDDRLCPRCRAEAEQVTARVGWVVDRSPSERMARAREAVEEQAQGYVRRFDARVRSRRSIVDPETGRPIAVGGWAATRLAGLPAWAGGLALDAPGGLLVASAGCRYTAPGRRASGSLFVQVVCLAALDPAAVDAAGTGPLGAAELGHLLRAAEVEAPSGRTCWLGLAAVGGWTEDAVEALAGYAHATLILVLIDLQSGQCHWNASEGRAVELAALFRPLSPEEEIAALLPRIERHMLAEFTLSGDEACKVWDTSDDIIEGAFNALKRTGRYQVRDLPGTGIVLASNL